MKIKMGQLVECETSLRDLAKMEMPASVGLKVSFIRDEVKNRCDLYREMVRDTVIRLGQEVIKDSGSYEVLPRNMAEFNEWHKDLLETELDLVGIGKLSLKKITQKKNITPEMISTLSWFLILDIPSEWDEGPEEEIEKVLDNSEE